MSEWATSWILSAILFCSTFVLSRRQFSETRHALYFSSIFFISPIGILQSSYNSAIYLFDLLSPFYILEFATAHLSRRSANSRLWLIVISAGVWPFLNGFLYASASVYLSIALVNAYRLIAIFALCRIIVPTLVRSDGMEWFHRVNFANSIIFVAVMIIQGSGLISANLYDRVMIDTAFYSEAYENYVDFADSKFSTLGMFKGAQALLLVVFATSAFAGVIASTSPRNVARCYITVVVTFLGLALTGAKTSLIAALATVLFSIFIRRNKYSMLAIFMIGALSVAFVGYVLGSPDAYKYVNTTLFAFITSSGADISTLDDRLERAAQVLELIADSPIILLGVFPFRVPELTTTFFHNEYLSILTLGGFISLFMYLFYIGTTFIVSILNSQRSEWALTATLLIFANLIQGYTVAHFQPGFLFLSSTFLSILLYELSLASARATPSPAAGGAAVAPRRGYP